MAIRSAATRSSFPLITLVLNWMADVEPSRGRGAEGPPACQEEGSCGSWRTCWRNLKVRTSASGVSVGVEPVLGATPGSARWHLAAQLREGLHGSQDVTLSLVDHGNGAGSHAADGAGRSPSPTGTQRPEVPLGLDL